MHALIHRPAQTPGIQTAGIVRRGGTAREVSESRTPSPSLLPSPFIPIPPSIFPLSLTLSPFFPLFLLPSSPSSLQSPVAPRITWVDPVSVSRKHPKTFPFRFCSLYLPGIVLFSYIYHLQLEYCTLPDQYDNESD